MISTTPTLSSDEGWRGIVPLRSTCEDVKRVPGVTACEFPTSTYYLEDETVTIIFSYAEKPCKENNKHALWNFPPYTVVEISVTLKKTRPVTDFHVDEGGYEKWVNEEAKLVEEDLVTYSNDKEGISIMTSKGEVRNVIYYPGDKNEHLRCPNAPNPQQTSSKQIMPSFFNYYGDIPFDEEKKLLDDFVRALQEYSPDSQGYIVVYRGRNARKGEAKARAERAKAYVLKTYGIREDRIGTVDGGCHEKMGVELHIGPHDLPLPMTFPSVCK